MSDLIEIFHSTTLAELQRQFKISVSEFGPWLGATPEGVMINDQGPGRLVSLIKSGMEDKTGGTMQIDVSKVTVFDDSFISAIFTAYAHHKNKAPEAQFLVTDSGNYNSGFPLYERIHVAHDGTANLIYAPFNEYMKNLGVKIDDVFIL